LLYNKRYSLKYLLILREREREREREYYYSKYISVIWRILSLNYLFTLHAVRYAKIWILINRKSHFIEPKQYLSDVFVFTAHKQRVLIPPGRRWLRIIAIYSRFCTTVVLCIKYNVLQTNVAGRHARCKAKIVIVTHESRRDGRTALSQ